MSDLLNIKGVTWTELEKKGGVSEKEAKDLANLINNSYVTVFRLVYVGDRNAKWLLKENGIGKPGCSYDNKKSAKKDSKKKAKESDNSVLIIENRDGRIQSYKHYTDGELSASSIKNI